MRMQKDPKSNQGETLKEGSQSRTEKLRLESTKTGSRKIDVENWKIVMVLRCSLCCSLVGGEDVTSKMEIQ
ncbi:hypothetical protein TNCV_3160661 [Trichonephila clavipes]|nr:hypothetical protein TNCV_3160661 [Trichonephila clavipes]